MAEGTILVSGDLLLESLVLADGAKPKLESLDQRSSADHAGRRESGVTIRTHRRPKQEIEKYS